MKKDLLATVGVFILGVVVILICLLGRSVYDLQQAVVFQTKILKHQTAVLETLAQQVNYNTEELKALDADLEALLDKAEVMPMKITAYTHTGYRTATMVYPKVGTIAVDPQVIPFGTKIFVPGYGWGVAEDTGPLIKGNRLDVFFNTEEECWEWGVEDKNVIVLR